MSLELLRKRDEVGVAKLLADFLGTRERVQRASGVVVAVGDGGRHEQEAARDTVTAELFDDVCAASEPAAALRFLAQVEIAKREPEYAARCSGKLSPLDQELMFTRPGVAPGRIAGQVRGLREEFEVLGIERRLGVGGRQVFERLTPAAAGEQFSPGREWGRLRHREHYTFPGGHSYSADARTREIPRVRTE